MHLLKQLIQTIGHGRRRGDTGRTDTVSLAVVGASSPASSAVTLTAGNMSGPEYWSGSRWVSVASILDVMSFHGGTTIERSLCPTLAIVADVAAQCGALRITHALPTTAVYGKGYAPTLAYFSDQTLGPSLLVNVTFPSTLPDSVIVNVFSVDANNVEGPLVKQVKFGGAAWAANRTQRINTGPLWPTTGPAGTALYTFDVEVRQFTNGGWTAAAPVARGTIANVERLSSQLGSGWWMLGLEQLYLNQPGNSVLWVGGDGSARRYVVGPTAGDTTAYIAPSVDHPDTLYRSGSSGWWRRALPGHVSVFFDQQGRHRETRNRAGRSTFFSYEDLSSTSWRLTGITLPGGSSAYSFAYGASAVTVTAPGGRITQLTRNGAGIASIVDPDLSAVSFGYSGASITSRTDRRLVPTNFTWASSAGMLASAATPNGTGGTVVQTIRSPRGSGLSTAGDPPVLPGDPDYVFDGPRPQADVVDVTKIWIDSLGAPSKITDAANRTATLTRDPVFQGLVKSVVQHSGFEERATYDARGNLETTLAVNPYGDGRDALTTYTWDQNWDQLTSMTLPEGEKTTFGVSQTNGNRLWQQDKRGAQSRVAFDYYTDTPRLGLIKTVTLPDRATFQSGMFKLTYDHDSLGNLRYVKSVDGVEHRIGRDGIGRVISDSAQIQKNSPNYWQIAATWYDDADNVTRTVTTGSTALAGSSRTQETRRFYDREGNLDSLETGPWTGRNGFLARRWTRDAFGRVLTEAVERDNQPGVWIADSTWYDLAGNVVTTKSRNGLVIQQQYDALNRMLNRSTPAVTYPQELIGLAGCTSGCNYVDSPLQTPYPFYPTAGTTGYTIDADQAAFAYDPATGSLADANNASAKVHRTYYRNGQLQGETQRLRTWVGDGSDASFSHVYTTTTTYDRNGRRVSLQYPGILSLSGTSATAGFGFDTTGALATVTDLEGRVNTFTYNGRDELVQHVVPASGVPLVEQWHTTNDGDLDQWGVRSQTSATFNLRNQAFDYDARGKVIAQRDSLILPVASLTTDYDGIGQLTRSMTRVGGEIRQSLYGTDGLGNVTGVKGSEANYFNGGGFASSSDSTGKRYDPISGRLVLTYDALAMSGDSTVGVKPFINRYDLSGNVVWNGRVAFSSTQSQMESRSYYGADNQLRAVDSRSWQGRFFNAFTYTFEEYRYDALGRRVVVRARRGCENMTDGTPQHYPRVDCAVSTIRRTIWDGSAELGEIQMPGVDGTDLEREAMPYETGAGSPPVNTNPFFGRVAYTYGLGVDRPVAVTRLNYSTLTPKAGGGWEVTTLAPFTVYPLWNTKGQSDLVAFTSTAPSYNNAQLLPGATPATACVRFDMGDNYWLAYLRQIGSRGSWHGTLLEDKQDASGTMYRRNRYYDPSTGRFTQEDPIGIAGGINLYGFANGDPVSYSDPFGLWPCCFVHGNAIPIAIDDAVRTLRFIDFHQTVVPKLDQLGQGLAVGAILGGAGGRAVSAEMATARSGLGDLTVSEVNSIQGVVNKAGRPLEVVGSAARGARQAGSDIDYVSGPSSIRNFEGLEGQLPGIDSHGIIPGTGNPYQGPVIRFEPQSAPRVIPPPQ